jgi:MFS family permease
LLRWLPPSCALVPEALIAPYVHVLHAPSRDVGILLSAIAAGMLVANLAVGRLAAPAQQRRLLIPMALLNVVPLIAFLAPVGLWVSVALLAASGIGSCYSLGRDSIFIATVPQEIRARALAIDSSGLMVVQGIGFVVWGALAEVLSVRSTIAVAGVVGVVVIATLGRIRDA